MMQRRPFLPRRGASLHRDIATLRRLHASMVKYERGELCGEIVFLLENLLCALDQWADLLEERAA